MKRFLVVGLVGISGAIAAGCPIYSDDDSNYDDYDWGCVDSADCSAGMACHNGYCTRGAGGGAGFLPAGPRGSAGASVDGGVAGKRSMESGGGGGASADAGRGLGGGLPSRPLPDSGPTMPRNAGGSAGTNAGGSAGTNAGGSAGTNAGGGAGTNAGGGAATSPDGGESGDAAAVDASVSAPPDASVDAGAYSRDDAGDVVVAPSTIYCGSPSDCPAGQTCDPLGVCRVGDCGAYACINQYVCSRTNQTLACTVADPSLCSADAQCGDAARCVDGTCTLLADLCSDQTQCPGGHLCVDGKCVTSCGTDAQCPSGFRCRTDTGMCSLAAQPCAKTSDCGSSTLVCIQNACVPRCGARGACGDGSGACVSNGCIPAQKTVHECEVDGESTGCGQGRVCLHHHCYVTCDAPNETACAGLVRFTACKQVKAQTSRYSVCASAQNLGGECDPTLDQWCAAGKSCIDGFCR